MKVVEFKNKKWEMCKFNYASGRTGFLMFEMNTRKETYFNLTLDIPNVRINEGEIIVKNYDFNTGILDVLLNNNIIDKQVKPITLGLNKVYLCKLI